MSQVTLVRPKRTFRRSKQTKLIWVRNSPASEEEDTVWASSSPCIAALFLVLLEELWQANLEGISVGGRRNAFAGTYKENAVLVRSLSQRHKEEQEDCNLFKGSALGMSWV